MNNKVYYCYNAILIFLLICIKGNALAPIQSSSNLYKNSLKSQESQAFKIEPDSLNFGEIVIQKTKELSFSISANDSLTDVVVESDSPYFSIKKDTLDINADTVTIAVQFTPTETAFYTGNIIVKYEDETDTLNLTGIGVKPTLYISDSEMFVSSSFPCNQSSIIRFYVKGEHLSSNINITTNSQAFTPSPTSLGTQGGYVTISYKPSSLSDFNGRITISSTGADTKTVYIKGLTHNSDTELSLQTYKTDYLSYSWNRDNNARSATLYNGNLYVKDRQNRSIYQVNPTTGDWTGYASYQGSTTRLFPADTDPETNDKNYYWAGWSVTSGNDGSLFASGNHGDYVGNAFGASYNGSTFTNINAAGLDDLGYLGRIDYFSLYGSTNNGKLAGVTVSGKHQDSKIENNDVICIWNMSNGSISGHSVNHIGKRNSHLIAPIQEVGREALGADIAWIDENQILVTGANTYPIIHNISNINNQSTKINLPYTTHVGGGAYFKIGTIPFIAIPQNIRGDISIFEISNPDVPILCAVSTPVHYLDNETRHISIQVEVDENKATIYAWTPNAGYAVYEFTTPFIWSGKTDSDWNKASNWKYTVAPPSNADIIIPPSCLNYPLLTEDLSLNSLQIDAGAACDISNHKMLIINTLISQGQFRTKQHLPTTVYAYGGIVEFYGDEQDVNIPGGLIFNILNINKENKTAFALGQLSMTQLNLGKTATLDMGVHTLKVEKTVNNLGLIRTAGSIPAKNYGGIVEYYGANNVYGPLGASSFNTLKILTNKQTFFAQGAIEVASLLEIATGNTVDMLTHELISIRGKIDNQHIIRSQSTIPATSYENLVEFYGDQRDIAGPLGAAKFDRLQINLKNLCKLVARGRIETNSLEVNADATLDMRSNQLIVNGLLSNQGLLQTISGMIPVRTPYDGIVEYYGEGSDVYITKNTTFKYIRVATKNGKKLLANTDFYADTLQVMENAIFDMQEIELFVDSVDNQGTIRTSDVIPPRIYGGNVEYYGGRKDLFTPIGASFCTLTVNTFNNKKLYASQDLSLCTLNTTSTGILDMLKFTLQANTIHNSGTIMTSGTIPTHHYGGIVEYYGDDRNLYTPENSSFTTLIVRMANEQRLIMSSDLTIYVLFVCEAAIFDIRWHQIFVTQSLSNEGHIMTQRHLPYNIKLFGSRVEYYGENNQEIHAATYHILHLNKLNDAIFYLGEKKELIADYLLINNSSILEIGTGRSVKVLIELENPRKTHGIILKAGRHQAPGTLIFNNEISKPISATVEMYSYGRYATNKDGYINDIHWQYFGIPFETLNDAGSLFKHSVIHEHHEAGNGTSNSNIRQRRWIPLSSHDQLYQFKGYSISQTTPGLSSFSGQLFNEDFSLEIPYTATGEYPGQHIISNPYSAAISIKDIDFDEALEKAIYTYTTGSYYDCFDEDGHIIGTGCGKMRGIYAGQYAVSPKYTAGIGGISNEIAPMQGFLVKTSKEEIVGGNIHIQYRHNIQNTMPQRAPQYAQVIAQEDPEIEEYQEEGNENIEEKAWLRLTIEGENSGDMLWLFSHPETSFDFDNGWDGRKLAGDKGIPVFYSYNETGIYQINAVPNIHNTDIYFGADKTDKTYTLTANNGGGMTEHYDKIYLEDKETDLLIDITQDNTQYTFVSCDVVGSSRFRILTNTDSRVVDMHTTDVYVYANDRTIFIQNNGNENSRIEIFDSTGRYLANFTCDASESKAIHRPLCRGTYIARVTTSRTYTKKMVVL